MGFLLGIVLAGVEGISASNLMTFQAETASSKRLDKYWQESGVGLVELEQLVSNSKCYKSQIYFQACINTIIVGATESSFKNFFVRDVLNISSKISDFEDLSEKEKMDLILKHKLHPNFNLAIEKIIKKEKVELQPILVANMINAFLAVYYDPHTYILPADFYSEVGSKLKYSKYFVGISYEKEKGKVVIKKVVKNSDAEISGLQNEDEILAINGTRLNQLKYMEISSILRNEKTDTLVFDVLRNQKKQKIYLKRSYRFVSQVHLEIIDSPRKYAVLTISKFSDGVCEEVASKLNSIKNESIKGLVLDLRDNPGGELDEVACLTGLFVGENKKVYYVEYFDSQKSNELILTSEKKIFNEPLVVMVNAYSASSAELFAGVIQDHSRGVIIGERTFGKGSFQEPEMWSLNKKIHLYKTQGLYLLPNQYSTQLGGITPDIEIVIEKNPKREKDIFFNPLRLTRENEKMPEKNKKISSQLLMECTQNKKLASVESRDKLLISGLNYIECISTAKGNLAQANTGKTTAEGL